MTINTIAKWEAYQGDGRNGPFGYIGGWFVNWKLEDGELRFALDRDEEDSEEPTHTEEEAEYFVDDWLGNEKSKSYSVVISELTRKIKEETSCQQK